MSRENVEVVRRVYEAANRGDFEGSVVDMAPEFEFVEAGDRVLVSLIARGRGKQSGVETGWDVWMVWTLRNGRIVRGQGFTSPDPALEAAGLRE